MFDARYFAYATMSALLVISPGATMAVVVETAVADGSTAALYTVIGVNIGNSTLALLSALGMSFAFTHWPWTMQVVKIGGAAYLTWLGLRGLWRSLKAPPAPTAASGVLESPGRRPRLAGTPAARRGIVRGIATNLLNPPVIVFYTTFLPQFIRPDDPFFGRFFVLAATHVAMSVAWLSVCAAALGVLAERMARPLVRRTLEGLTGILLVGFGIRLLIG
jgi:threonine/homoserine/homoserine lactone efflux protein